MCVCVCVSEWNRLKKKTWRPSKMPCLNEDTLPETNSSPLKIGHPKRKLVFQPQIFKRYVGFRECNWIGPDGSFPRKFHHDDQIHLREIHHKITEVLLYIFVAA